MNRTELFRRMRKSKFFVIGFSVVLILLFIAIISPYIISHDPYTASLSQRLKPPQWFSNGWNGYILGTDPLGRDILSRLFVGSRVSLTISVIVVLITAAIGTFFGVIAGFYGGKVDMIIMRISEVQSAIPTMMLAIAVIAILGNSITNLVCVLVLSRWIQYTRIVRGNVLSIRRAEYISASRILGGSDLRIMFTQVLPNVLTALIIVISQGFGEIILIESSLSFLGLGVPAPNPSWGSMISEGRTYLTNAPWVVVAPGAALMIAVLAFNFLGDGIRDVLDPKNKD